MEKEIFSNKLRNLNSTLSYRILTNNPLIGALQHTAYRIRTTSVSPSTLSSDLPWFTFITWPRACYTCIWLCECLSSLSSTLVLHISLTTRTLIVIRKAFFRECMFALGTTFLFSQLYIDIIFAFCFHNNAISEWFSEGAWQFLKLMKRFLIILTIIGCYLKEQKTCTSLTNSLSFSCLMLALHFQIKHGSQWEAFISFRTRGIRCSSVAMLTKLIMQTTDWSSLDLPRFIHRIRQNYSTR